MVKNISKNIRTNLSGKYSQKLLDRSKKSAADALKTSSKRVIQKTAEATGSLIVIKSLRGSYVVRRQNYENFKKFTIK